MTVKLWSKHWVTLTSRPFTHRVDAPLLLLSVEKGALGEREIPVTAEPVFRHYMSNVFIYLMPAADLEADIVQKGLVHGWELKVGMSVEEAKQFAAELLKTIDLCEKRRQERRQKASV